MSSKDEKLLPLQVTTGAILSRGETSFRKYMAVRGTLVSRAFLFIDPVVGKEGFSFERVWLLAAPFAARKNVGF
jgi:hypothetical protein